MDTTEGIDLDAIEARAKRVDTLRQEMTNPGPMTSLDLGAASIHSARDVSPLIAEVRRLREEWTTEQEIHKWFTGHSSAAVARVIADGQSVIDERMADGVFE